MSTHTVPTICRLCIAHCGVLATVEDGRLLRVEGDPANPMFHGYTCPKGRALPDLHNHAGRLLHSVKRADDGSHAAIAPDAAMDEIAAKLAAIVERHGPRAVAMYTGTNSLPYPLGAGMGNALMRALGSPMFFTSNTIDQPGKQIAAAAHGHWMAGDLDFDRCDTWLLLGLNPIISKAAGIPSQNPAQRIKDAVARGMKLIVVDPRVSDTARKAHLHLQPRPGEDAAILAGIIRVIITEGLYDRDFLDRHAEGFEALSRHVEPFTPDYVAARADIPAAQLVEAARVFAAGRGMANSGSGPSFSMHANIIEYLVLGLNTLCGRWPRAGEAVTRPNALLPAYTPKEQAFPPYTGWGYGERMRVRGLSDAACGMPTGALADEILLPGEGQVKALICVGGNPLGAWPDQRKTGRALAELELLVTLDVEMSATARVADYVIATLQTLETPGMTQGAEGIKYFTPGLGYAAAYAQYSPRVVAPPPGSDLIEEWQLFHGLATRMKLDLVFVNYFGAGRFQEAPSVILKLDAATRTTTEELYERLCATARVPLEAVKAAPHGVIVEGEVLIEPADAGSGARLCIGNATLLAELDAIAAEDFRALHDTPALPFRLIPRRHNNFMNSTGVSLRALNGGRAWNPAWMHPDDIAALGMRAGNRVRIASESDAIVAELEADPTLRRGLVAMTHGFGGLPDEDARYAELGSNTGRLMRTDVDYDPLTGMPRMGNLPVRIEAA